jgi:TusA-related sulfurtransferase
MEPKGRKPALEPLSERPGADRILDTVGFYCPVPIIKTSAQIREMMPGQVLEVLSDDRVILVDMPAWCKSAGHDYVGHLEEEGEIHLFVRKAGRNASGTVRRR